MCKYNRMYQSTPCVKHPLLLVVEGFAKPLASLDAAVQNLDSPPLYLVNIDFDEASREWNANKKKGSNGCRTYCCGFIKKNGKPCKRPEHHRNKHK